MFRFSITRRVLLWPSLICIHENFIYICHCALSTCISHKIWYICIIRSQQYQFYCMSYIFWPQSTPYDVYLIRYWWLEKYSQLLKVSSLHWPLTKRNSKLRSALLEPYWNLSYELPPHLRLISRYLWNWKY